MLISRTTETPIVKAKSAASVHGTRSAGARRLPGKSTNTNGSITSTSA